MGFDIGFDMGFDVVLTVCAIVFAICDIWALIYVIYVFGCMCFDVCDLLYVL